MILADTSAWVEYDRATGSATDLRLSELIAADGPVAVTEPVIMEVVAGARWQCGMGRHCLPAMPIWIRLRTLPVSNSTSRRLGSETLGPGTGAAG